ncbi:MAG: hypothetical protein A2Y54_11100 [Chloroflexi bacterium RBG_16_51_16]|nr:MAG: hypothetical protein A2Y54_11100 [Chloroflexi bacterium RBG_16_51_16]
MPKKLMLFLPLISSLLLSACSSGIQPGKNQEYSQTSYSPLKQDEPSGQEVNEGDPSVTGTITTAGNPKHVDVLDFTHLELGDNKISASPQRGFVFSCMTYYKGSGPAATGWWLNGDGTWDLTKKAVVDGSVSWTHEFSITLSGDQRIITGNGLPDHTTGVYPISSTDDAYKVDRNPNEITNQTIALTLPANPSLSASATCVGGEVGILLSGIAIFNAFDALGRDAAANEVQDGCDGHPQQNGFYHYHTLSECIEDVAAGHSALMGYAFDGFGIFGYYSEDGKEITNADLDECHGHSHTIEWDGQTVEMYHYHATREFPYTVGCFRGDPVVRGLSIRPGGGQASSGQAQSQFEPQPAAQSQGGVGGQPPQAAIDACLNQPAGAMCSINDQNRTIRGACDVLPQGTQLACMPLGGPP